MTEELWKHVFICFYPDLSDRSGLEKKTKPTSFPREYTSSAFCHIIRLSLKQSYMAKTNVLLYSVRRQQLRDRLPVGIHLNVIRGT